MDQIQLIAIFNCLLCLFQALFEAINCYNY